MSTTYPKHWKFPVSDEFLLQYEWKDLFYALINVPLEEQVDLKRKQPKMQTKLLSLLLHHVSQFQHDLYRSVTSVPPPMYTISHEEDVDITALLSEDDTAA